MPPKLGSGETTALADDSCLLTKPLIASHPPSPRILFVFLKKLLAQPGHTRLLALFQWVSTLVHQNHLVSLKNTEPGACQVILNQTPGLEHRYLWFEQAVNFLMFPFRSFCYTSCPTKQLSSFSQSQPAVLQAPSPRPLAGGHGFCPAADLTHCPLFCGSGRH